jgi:SM-20-related protein
MQVGANPACYNFAMHIDAHPSLDDDLVISTLIAQGYVIIDQFLPESSVAALAHVAKTTFANHAMSSARTGKHAEMRQDIRGDHIYWLEENSPDPATQQYLSQMQQLKQHINEQLYMGLASLETHFAIYPVGAVYQKHLDQFSGHVSTQINTRKISAILYLNSDWQAMDGGELRLYINDQKWEDILPIGGRLVLFLSADFWHEVLPATRERISLSGWFRTREPQPI